MTGRAASLPPRDAPRGIRGASPLSVQHVDELSGQARTYDFATLDLSPALQAHFALVFATAAGPHGGWGSERTASAGWTALRRFAAALGEAQPRPLDVRDLRPAHLTAYRLLVGTDGRSLGSLKSMLLRGDGYEPAFRAALTLANPKRAKNELASYSASEMRRITRSAQTDVRLARARIRKHQALLAKWRAGEVATGTEEARLGALLDALAQGGDVRRHPAGQPDPGKAGYSGAGCTSVADAYGRLFLTSWEAIAFHVLLVALTGQNGNTISNAPAAHHRADAGEGPAIAVLDLVKRRRGKRRAHMQVPFTDVPDWSAAPADRSVDLRDEVTTPFGVYALLLQLGADARRVGETDRLFAWWAGRAGGGQGRGIRTGVTEDRYSIWGSQRGLLTDDGDPLVLSLARLRLSVLQHRDEPVAHTRRTLRDAYQIKDRRALVEYQQVVGDVLRQQVERAHETARLRFLTAADVEEAATNPDVVASRLGVSAQALKRLLQGDLDTVLAACSDNLNGPYNPGDVCGASFTACLGCPCARALPRHLPRQVALHDALLGRKDTMTPLDWARLHGLVWERLRDILDQQPQGVVERAREAITPTDRDAVQLLLDGDFELRR